MIGASEIPLRNPVEIGGRLVSSLSVRPALDEDFAAIGRINARAEVKAMKLVSRVTGLDWRALAKIEAVNKGFLAQVDSLLAPEA